MKITYTKYLTAAITLGTLAITGCGGGGGSSSSQPGTSSENLSANKILSSGEHQILAAKIRSNSMKTLVAWKTLTSTDYSYLYKAEKEDGVWHYPSGSNDYLERYKDAFPFLSWFDTEIHISMNGTGNAIIVNNMIRKLKNTNSLVSRISVTQYKDHEWKPGFFIDPYGGQAVFPSVAMDQNNNAIITWTGSADNNTLDFNNVNPYKAMYINGIWNVPVDNNDHIGLDGGGKVGFFTTVNYRNNNAFITWFQQEDNTTSAPMRLYESDYSHGTFSFWIKPKKDESLSKNVMLHMPFSLPVKTAMDDQGNKLIVWLASDMNEIMHLYTAEYCNNMWHTPHSQQDHIDNTYTKAPITGDFPLTDIAANGNGFSIVTWSQYDNDGKHIYARRYYLDNCTSVLSDSDTALNHGTDGKSDSPHVAVNNNNEGALIWVQEYQNKKRLYLATYENDNWHIPAPSQYIGGKDHNVSEIGLDIAINDNGEITTVWTEYSDSNHSTLYMKELQLNY